MINQVWSLKRISGPPLLPAINRVSISRESTHSAHHLTAGFEVPRIIMPSIAGKKKACIIFISTKEHQQATCVLCGPEAHGLNCRSACCVSFWSFLYRALHKTGSFIHLSSAEMHKWHARFSRHSLSRIWHTSTIYADPKYPDGKSWQRWWIRLLLLQDKGGDKNKGVLLRTVLLGR